MIRPAAAPSGPPLAPSPHSLSATSRDRRETRERPYRDQRRGGNRGSVRVERESAREGNPGQGTGMKQDPLAPFFDYAVLLSVCCGFRPDKPELVDGQLFIILNRRSPVSSVIESSVWRRVLGTGGCGLLWDLLHGGFGLLRGWLGRCCPVCVSSGGHDDGFIACECTSHLPRPSHLPISSPSFHLLPHKHLLSSWVSLS